jgi:hypothetical protein
MWHTISMRRFLFLAAILLLWVTGCVEEEATPALVDPTGFVTYLHPTGVFSLDLPPNWVVGDTSDETAVNVEFSPPDSPEPLINVYVITASALPQPTPFPGGDPSMITPTPASPDFEPLLIFYQTSFYNRTDWTYKEIGRDDQPDGSVRIRFLIDAPSGTSQRNDFIQVIGPYFVAMRILLPEDHAQMRTLTRIVNTLDVNDGAGWASVLPQEDTAPHDVVGFASLNAWADQNGGFVVVGQVVNNAPLALEFVRISAQLYDADGNLMGQQDDFVSSDLVLPGEYTPFSIIFTDGLPAGTVRYDLYASARYADYAARSFYGPQNFAVTSEANFDEHGLLVIGGQVRNEGNQTASLVKVIVTVFNDQQRVIATDTTLVDLQRLAPGETSSYTVSFVELGGTPHNFMVTAQGIIDE